MNKVIAPLPSLSYLWKSWRSPLVSHGWGESMGIIWTCWAPWPTASIFCRSTKAAMTSPWFSGLHLMTPPRYSLWMIQTNGKCANNTPSSQTVKTKKRALTGASLFLCFGNSPTRRLWQEPVLAEVVWSYTQPFYLGMETNVFLDTKSWYGGSPLEQNHMHTHSIKLIISFQKQPRPSVSLASPNPSSFLLRFFSLSILYTHRPVVHEPCHWLQSKHGMKVEVFHKLMKFLSNSESICWLFI